MCKVRQQKSEVAMCMKHTESMHLPNIFYIASKFILTYTLMKTRFLFDICFKSGFKGH